MIFVLAISLHQDIMQRAQAEIDAVVGRDRMPTFQDAEKLPYISALMREIIRWNTMSLAGGSCYVLMHLTKLMVSRYATSVYGGTLNY